MKVPEMGTKTDGQLRIGCYDVGRREGIEHRRNRGSEVRKIRRAEMAFYFTGCFRSSALPNLSLPAVFTMH